jgi:hypothetical protein
MVKYGVILFFILCSTQAQDRFERHCVPCHRTLPTTLQEFFKHYLLVYSSEANVKAAIQHYLEYPAKDISVMPELFIKNYGIKAKSNLSSKTLKEAVAFYWEKYKVFGKLE